MPRIQTLTDVGNLALSRCGQPHIHDIHTEGPVPNLLRTHIYDVIEQVQSEKKWPECEVDTKLQLSTEDTEDGIPLWNIPASKLNIIGLVGSSIEYREVRGKLATNHSAPILRYTAYNENVSEWSPFMLRRIKTELAAVICYPLTSDKTLTQKLALEAARSESVTMQNLVNATRSRNRRPGRYGWRRARAGQEPHE